MISVPPPPFDPASARAALPSVRDRAYFNAGTFGPVPESSAEAMRAHAVRSLEVGRIGTEGFRLWMDLIAQARAGFATTLGCAESEVALMHCTTDAVNTVVWGLSWNVGDEVITTTAEHPGLTAPLEALAARFGVTIRAVAPTLAAVTEALSARTRLVALSHVLWTDGTVLDVAAVARAAHAYGARVLVDGAQSAGALPLRLVETHADFYTVSGQKWLCGPSGTGALWVAPHALDALSIAWPGYLSHDRFSPGGPHPWPDARRLDASTLSLTSLAGVAPALAFWRTHANAGGLAHAASLAASLRSRLAARADVSLLATPSPSSMVSFRVAGRTASEVNAALERAGVLVRSIPGVDCVRVSVGFWNDAADVDRLVTALG